MRINLNQMLCNSTSPWQQPGDKLWWWGVFSHGLSVWGSTLAYLHASNIVHRDLKSKSILLDHNFHVKVTNFGISQIFPDDLSHVSTEAQGTPGYFDSNYLHYYQLSYMRDVYSFGVFLFELISSMHPVLIDKDITLAAFAEKKIQSNALHELVDPSLGFDSNIIVRKMILSVSELAVRCLRHEGELRPSIDTVLEALQGIESEKHELGNKAIEESR